MRIVDIRELSVLISRYADPSVPSGGLTTSMVALITDVTRNDEGFAWALTDDCTKPQNTRLVGCPAA
jgi:hypothetical protein